VYSGVKILYPMFTIKGLTHKISFDVSRMKRVRWENSKRLIFGSLLCLSKDNFETFLLATVENRDENEIKTVSIIYCSGLYLNKSRSFLVDSLDLYRRAHVNHNANQRSTVLSNKARLTSTSVYELVIAHCVTSINKIILS
jgi:hypothetical protein